MISKKDNMNLNDNKNNNEEENGSKKEDIKSNIYLLKVEELKNELKKRNIDIPKNAKKKDLQEILINTQK